MNFLVQLTSRLSRGQPDPHQSKKFMFMWLFSSEEALGMVSGMLLEKAADLIEHSVVFKDHCV